MMSRNLSSCSLVSTSARGHDSKCERQTISVGQGVAMESLKFHPGRHALPFDGGRPSSTPFTFGHPTPLTSERQTKHRGRLIAGMNV
jgi:hypothetical protein